MRYLVYDIIWDTESDGIHHDAEDLELPSFVEVEADDEDEAVDAVTDKYGWCIIDSLVMTAD